MVSNLITYSLTHSLTSWSRVLLEKLTGYQLVKKFLAFTRAHHLSLYWALFLYLCTEHSSCISVLSTLLVSLYWALFLYPSTEHSSCIPLLSTLLVSLYWALLYPSTEHSSCIAVLSTLLVSLYWELILYPSTEHSSCIPVLSTHLVSLYWALFLYPCTEHSCIPVLSTLLVSLYWALFFYPSTEQLLFLYTQLCCTRRILEQLRRWNINTCLLPVPPHEPRSSTCLKNVSTRIM
jgi:hypothetical protein